MIYPRLYHDCGRLVALICILLMLSSCIFGIFVILWTFNDMQVIYVVKSDSMSGEKCPKSTTNSPHQTILANNDERKLKLNATQYIFEKKNFEPDEVEKQQNIYIDDFYTTNTKPKLVYDKYTVEPKPGTRKSDDDSYIKKGPKAHNKSPTALNYNDDSDDSYDSPNDNDASGSGDFYNSNDKKVYDMETNKFIRRISLKLLQLSKRNKSSTDQQPSTNAHNNQLPTESSRRRKKVYFGLKATQKRNSLKLTTPATALELSSFSTALPDNFGKWKGAQVRTRRIIGNEKKSAERSRQLLLCEKGKSGGGELCRMLFKET